MRHAILGILLLVAATVWTSANATAAEDASERPGLVADKPASGPSVKTEHGYMVPYQQTIPGTDVSFDMIPIPGGTFLMGSPASEADRQKDEGPQVRVQVAPFWMSKTEITWAEYQVFMSLYGCLKQLEDLRNVLADDVPLQVEGKTPLQIRSMKNYIAQRIVARAALRVRLESPKMAALDAHLKRLPEAIDAITAPTELYDPDTTYEYGSEPDQPAVSMTQYAAKQYTKWMTRLTGRFYRLPSGAEWEYACRAGTTTAYSFGDDPKPLGEYAWYEDNADFELQTVGSKKPNPWGLHDMHGSVAEWVLDAYDAEGYTISGKPPVSGFKAINWPQRQYPRTVRGGSLEDDPAACRSASRMGSEEEWKEVDPNLPKSPWWFTDDPARGVGFRLIEPLDVPSAEQQAKFWEIDVKSVRFAVDSRLEGGRGVRDNVHADLPKVLEQLLDVKKGGE